MIISVVTSYRYLYAVFSMIILRIQLYGFLPLYQKPSFWLSIFTLRDSIPCQWHVLIHFGLFYKNTQGAHTLINICHKTVCPDSSPHYFATTYPNNIKIIIELITYIFLCVSCKKYPHSLIIIINIHNASTKTKRMMSNNIIWPKRISSNFRHHCNIHTLPHVWP